MESLIQLWERQGIRVRSVLCESTFTCLKLVGMSDPDSQSMSEANST